MELLIRSFSGPAIVSLSGRDPANSSAESMVDSAACGVR